MEGHLEPDRARGWVLALVSVASFMVVLDLLVVSTALSAIQAGLGASLAELEWTVNSYTLSFAVLLMTATVIGDRLGRRRVFAAGLALFALASAACAVAPGTGALIAARAVQGAGAATIMPLALSQLNAAFPPERRGWALGVYGSVTGLGAVLGPVVGGAVTQGLDWRWIFWLNVPVAAVVIGLGYARLRETFGPRARLDLGGLALVSAASLGLVWGLVRGNAAGWLSPEVAGTLVGGAVLAAGFVAWERRAAAPMLPMRLFGSRAFSAGNLAVFCLNGSMAGAIFFTAQFEQVTLGYGALGAGLGLLPWGLTPFLLAMKAGALADRFGTRPLVIAGLGLQLLGMAWLALVASPGAGYPVMVAPMLVSGAGLALGMPAVTKSVVGSVAPGDIGTASGAYTTMRQLGGAFGVAVPAAVFAAAGSYDSPSDFGAGYPYAIAAAAALSAVGTLAACALPRAASLPAVARSTNARTDTRS
ncbi:DHA2 family efflux MFS transporter permease subunit [Pseudonocardia acaciae]|uniref:DHA2 family efflux MFS transporter permease subunit n=1 Tax=Pseudonocardia acaciae TaxID=551276 RepID=UPI000A47F27D|nr:DHA2 family efflux MFS transporter permease subunit [Pseudonocardia acaciae]